MNATIVVPGASLTQTADGAGEQDRLLQLARRLDWRFLLPSPELTDVAYLGPADAVLIEALRTFSTSLHVFPTGCNRTGNERHPAARQYPLVVARDPARHALSELVHSLKAGGVLYLEVDQRAARGLLGKLRSYRGYCTALRGLGLESWRTYWHWPRFDCCERLVPLDDPAAVRHALACSGGSWRSRGQSHLARALFHCRLLTPLVPCLSILGQKHP